MSERARTDDEPPGRNRPDPTRPRSTAHRDGMHRRRRQQGHRAAAGKRMPGAGARWTPPREEQRQPAGPVPGQRPIRRRLPTRLRPPGPGRGTDSGPVGTILCARLVVRFPHARTSYMYADTAPYTHTVGSSRGVRTLLYSRRVEAFVATCFRFWIRSWEWCVAGWGQHRKWTREGTFEESAEGGTAGHAVPAAACMQIARCISYPTS